MEHDLKTAKRRGRSSETIELLEACRGIIEAVQPISVRGVCYRLFVQGLIDSMHVSNTQKISRLLVRAREEELIPWEWIVDESRQMEGGGGFADLEQYGRIVERSYRRDFWAHQKQRVILISEKATVAGILRPVLEEYGVPFFALHGFNSATKVHDLAEEISGDKRQAVMLYCGDYDPSGMYMSERDLPGRLSDYGAGSTKDGDYDFRRIALTYIDVHGGNLPSFKAESKKKDPRYQWFISRYGERSWELDAMDPNDLRARVRQEVERYIDPGDWEQHTKIEAVQMETTKRIALAMTQAGANLY